MQDSTQGVDPPGGEDQRPSPAPADKIPELSVVMPVHNEEEVLPHSIFETVGILDTVARQWELILVDDGSTDGTRETLARWEKREPRIRILTQRPKRGYSKALARGFAAARHLVVLYSDADAQYDLREVLLLFPHLRGADMVAGYRLRRQDPWQRRLASAVYNRLVTLALGVRARDVNCAFKLFRRSFLEMFEPVSEGFLIDAELFVRARRAGLRWVEVGVTHRKRQRGVSKIRLGMATETLRQLWQLRRSL